MNVSANTFIRLREVYVVNSLKKQISQMKKVIAKKEEEIEGFKSNLRCAKYSKLEYNYANNLNQLIQIKKENETLRSNFEDITTKYTEEVEQNQRLINSLAKYRSQYDDLKIKAKMLEDSNNDLAFKNKLLEEKVNLLNKSILHQPVQLRRISVKQKDNTINSLKAELQEIKDKSKAERLRLERRVYFMTEDFKKAQEALR